MIFLMFFSIFLNVLLLTLLVVSVYRLFQYDSFVKFMNNDVVEIVKFMKSLVSRELFSNTPEIVAVHKEFTAILEKMERYQDIIRKRSVSSNINNEDKPVDRRPVVID